MRSAVKRRLALCENSWAGPATPLHLRWISPTEALRTGGFNGATTLCGSYLDTGWDVALVTDQDELTRVPAGQPGATCPGCLAAAHGVTAADTQTEEP